MRLLCASCGRILPIGRWSIEQDILHLACRGCGADAAVPRTSSSTSPVAQPTRTARGVDEAALPAVVSIAAPLAIARADAPPMIGAATDEPEWLVTGWAELQESWQDEAAHARLCVRAIAAGDPASLGARYKAHLTAAPDDEAARKGRDELIRRASAAILASAPIDHAVGERAKRLRVVVFIVAVLLLVGVVAWLASVVSNMGGS